MLASQFFRQCLDNRCHIIGNRHYLYTMHSCNLPHHRRAIQREHLHILPQGAAKLCQLELIHVQTKYPNQDLPNLLQILPSHSSPQLLVLLGSDSKSTLPRQLHEVPPLTSLINFYTLSFIQLSVSIRLGATLTWLMQWLHVPIVWYGREDIYAWSSYINSNISCRE